LDASDANIGRVFSCEYGAMMGCCACRSPVVGSSLVISLRNNLAICPTHYSIRNGGCYGMSGDWNLCASPDGNKWITIHEARGKGPLYGGVNAHDNETFSMMADAARNHDGHSFRTKDIVAEYMEKNHRHIWTIDSSVQGLYTQFRFISVPISDEEGAEERFDCLHGIGFEIYGDVYEEWEQSNSIGSIGYMKPYTNQPETLQVVEEETAYMPCNRGDIRYIVGELGVTLKDLQKRSSCNIEVNQNKGIRYSLSTTKYEISITGPRQGIENAKQMLREVLALRGSHHFAGGIDS